MIASRFTKVFQLTALVLVFSVAQLYVIAAPVKANTDPKAKETASTSQPRSELALADSSADKTATATTLSAESQMLTAEAAAEKMPLTAGSKALFNRIFSKKDMAARIATGNTFLKAQATFKDTFKASSAMNFARPQTDSDSDDDSDSGKKGMWIAAGVVAAVVVIAIVGLRHDRENSSAH
jgi:outer membrane scaffolding protein for murein synthesis (MipA/OmpV family)